MKSKDVMKAELKDKFAGALEDENFDKMADTLVDFAMSVQNEVLADYHMYQKTADATILAKRGIRQLSSEETDFYQKIIDNVKSGKIKQAVTNAELTFPETIITDVTTDIRKEFPLLAAIDFVTVSVITKLILNDSDVQLGAWGKITAEIKEEIEGAIKLIDLKSCKYTAFMCISKDLVDAGLSWIDSYVRALLVEAAGNGLCAAISIGSGKDMPIGMNRNISADAAVVDGEYPEKQLIAISDLSADTLGTLFSMLTVNTKGKARRVNGVIMVVNPKDYYSKVFPAIAYQNAQGEWVTRPALPVTFIEEPEIPEGRAVFGIGKKYFCGASFGGKTGNIESSDDVMFFEDERATKIKLFANGRARDDNDFLWLDISDLEAAVLPVNVITKTKYKVRLTVTPKTIATVAVANADGESVGDCVVDTSSGDVYIPALENGTYTLTVSGEGYDSKTEEFTVDNAALELGTISITKTQ